MSALTLRATLASAIAALASAPLHAAEPFQLRLAEPDDVVRTVVARLDGRSSSPRLDARSDHSTWWRDRSQPAMAMFADAPAELPADASAGPRATSATGAGDSDTALAKLSQNPIANLISVPFQNNTTFGVGPDNDAQNILNIQPVIPFNLTKELLVVTRTIVPVVYQPSLAPEISDEFGLGDITFTAFFSPAADEGFMWGAGPAFLFPSATSSVLGQGKWGLGPSVVGLYSKGPWVVGALANNIWSYAGDNDRPDVNQLLVQPFINFNLPGGWYLTTAPIITANWEADSGNRWTVPIGGGVGKVLRLGELPLNVSLQAYWNAERPETTGEWTLRFQVALLFPR